MPVKAKSRVYGKKARVPDSFEEAFASLALEEALQKDSKSGVFVPRWPLQPALSNSSDILSEQTKFSHTKQDFSDSTHNVRLLTSLKHVSNDVHDFEQICQLWSDSYCITKIAHGSYAAIFRLQLRSDASKYVVGKLIPLKPRMGKGSRAVDQTSIEDAATEVKALDTMSEIPGFVGFSEAWVLKGALPALFKAEYENWALSHPDDGFTGYSKDQLWCFIEMSDAGTDLEQVWIDSASSLARRHKSMDGKRFTVTECWDIFWGIAEALGRGEEFSEFEHRDLHAGNVCIMAFDGPASSMNEPTLRKRFTNLQVTLIDYTLSRVTLANGEILANTMKDKSIFAQRIDRPRTEQQLIDNQQYEMYRKMRQLVIEHPTGKGECQAWHAFVPQTNILWLYHILSVLLKSTDECSKTSVNGKALEVSVNGHCRSKTQFQDRIIAKVQPTPTDEAEVRRLLQTLIESLNPERGKGSEWSSAKDLLACNKYWSQEMRLDHDDGTTIQCR